MPATTSRSKRRGAAAKNSSQPALTSLSTAATLPEAPSMLEQVLAHLEQNNMRREALVLVWLLLLLLRWLVSLHGYSGAASPPMFGDYEAQRHWMEITLQLPASQWYFNTTTNDLLYWGLDYPPLTAFVSYAFGAAAHRIEPAMVDLSTSRGYESPTSKVFMRATVVLCDVVVLFPAMFYLARVLYKRTQWTQRIALPLFVLSQPALLLIDHGHFQYNNVTLGLTVLAVALLLRGREFLGSVAFCLALNFKQMSLYYAPAVGVFLFARCVYRPYAVLHLLKLALAVVATFALLWAPFCLHPAPNETCVSSMQQVLHRIFPFARGLFEDKVANVWCVLDVVYKIKRHVTPVEQMRLCTFATLLAFLPSIVDLVRRKPTRLRFMLALVNSSLAFFLFSFQVHEKSILLPLLPMSLLFSYNALVAGWFSVVATFSMFFLLLKDGLVLPYVVLQLLFVILAIVPFVASRSFLLVDHAPRAPGLCVDGSPHTLVRVLVILSLLGIVVVHAAHAFISPPLRYPHIHDYVFATYACGHFVLALVYCTYWQWTTVEETDETDIKATLHKTKIA